MHNTYFLSQLEEFRRYLWGAGCVDTRAAAEEASRSGYVPPADVEILPCHEDPNGEWVPNLVEPASEELEERVCIE